jgi:hypothetical protein
LQAYNRPKAGQFASFLPAVAWAGRFETFLNQP